MAVDFHVENPFLSWKLPNKFEMITRKIYCRKLNKVYIDPIIFLLFLHTDVNFVRFHLGCKTFSLEQFFVLFLTWTMDHLRLTDINCTIFLILISLVICLSLIIRPPRERSRWLHSPHIVIEWNQTKNENRNENFLDTNQLFFPLSTWKTELQRGLGILGYNLRRMIRLQVSIRVIITVLTKVCNEFNSETVIGLEKFYQVSYRWIYKTE